MLSALILSLLAPLFRRMRATFSRFNFLCLCLAPPSGKTFINSFSKRRPLSSLTRHSPRRGKRFIPAFACHSPRRGKLFIPALARHSPRRGKLFIPALACHSPRRGKLFIPAFTRHSPRRGKLFYISRRGKLSYIYILCLYVSCFVLLYVI